MHAVSAVLLLVSLMFRNIFSQQCRINTYSIYQMMLKGHTFKTFQARPLSADCIEACNSDVRCQSYNYVMFKNICELNNRTKEARPEDFVKDRDRYYMTKALNRVPLGFIPELPADSCREIKASEGGQAVSGAYWLDSTRSGDSILVRCDMKTGNIENCYNGLRSCHSNATCNNTKGSYNCTCKPGFYGDGRTSCKVIDNCYNGLRSCHSNATCNNTKGSYNCTCNPGFRGDGRTSCKDIDECTEGLHNCHGNAFCSNTKGSHSCTCKSGFRGDGHSCNDIDECTEDLHNCHGNAFCSNTKGSHSCTCKSGFRGDGHSCNDIDECAEDSHGCHKDATCQNAAGSFKCTCKAGYLGNGKSCDPEECKVHETLNNANRKTTYKTKQPYKCDDSLGPGWFRFKGQAGTRMPTECVEYERCHTKKPGWLKGGHPSVADGQVTKKVCFRGKKDCCFDSINIKVRNCGSYYVYRFKGISGACDARYCGTG